MKLKYLRKIGDRNKEEKIIESKLTNYEDG